MVNSEHTVFLFIGNDSYSKEQALRKIERSLLDSSSREFDYKVFDGANTEARDILDHVSTIPFLASKRLVVVRNFEKLSAEDVERVLIYIKNPIKSTCLVLDAGDESVLKQYPQISRYVILNRFAVLADSRFHARAKEILSSAPGGKDISSDASKALKELYGDDMGSVAQELQKLSSFAGDRARIEVRDVEELSGKNPDSSAFDLTDAIEALDLKGALSIISELMLSGKKHYEIIGLLCWQMNRLFKGRILMDRGTPLPQIAGLFKINPRYQDRFFRQLKAHSLAQIESNMEVLLETDLGIKSSKYDPDLALEFAVIKLCLGASTGLSANPQARPKGWLEVKAAS
ncbi:MAG: DNA polymerase III subunit delta [Candidatus Omnitrophota bacterium]|nr:DNA polymerase III subunit delta [Candidatus Omnitrophota bacterium]